MDIQADLFMLLSTLSSPAAIMSMRKKATLSLGVGAVCILLIVYLAHAWSVCAFHNDSCLVIAMTVANKIEAGEAVSEDEVRSEIASLVRGSVIHGRVDRDGHPTDLNGNEFRIEQSSDKVVVSTEFSFLQPKRSRAEVAVKAHNHIKPVGLKGKNRP